MFVRFTQSCAYPLRHPRCLGSLRFTSKGRSSDKNSQQENDLSGTGMKEYETTTKGGAEGRPYDMPGSNRDRGGEKMRYGGREEWVDDKGAETSHPGEGPEGTEKGGRKPERG